MLIEIRKAIVAKLKTLDIKVIANEIKSGFDKPAFFIQSNLVNQDSDIDMNVNLVMVNIHYFSKDKTELDNLKMIEKLKKLFIVTLKTDSRVFTLTEKSYEIYDNVLQFKFSIRYTDENEVEENEPMQEIEFNQNI